MKKVKFLKPIGSMKKSGEIYIKGLYGVPEYYKKEGYREENDWWWREGMGKEECHFLHNNVIKAGVEKEYILILK